MISNYYFLGVKLFTYDRKESVIDPDELGSVCYFNVKWVIDIPEYSRQFPNVVVHNNGTFSLLGETEEGPTSIKFIAIESFRAEMLKTLKGW